MKIPRVLLAAGASGSGKTLLTCGLLQVLVNRGIQLLSNAGRIILILCSTAVLLERNHEIWTLFLQEKTEQDIFWQKTLQVMI